MRLKYILLNSKTLRGMKEPMLTVVCPRVSFVLLESVGTTTSVQYLNNQETSLYLLTLVFYSCFIILQLKYSVSVSTCPCTM